MGVLPVIGGGDGGLTTIAALRDGSGALLCSGTLIGTDAILTAGHCARSDLATVDVNGGSFAVVSSVAYPDAAATEDVAVVFLASGPSEPATHLGLGWSRFDIVDGGRALVAGYGTTDANGTVLPVAQQVGQVEITDATCAHAPGCHPQGELAAGGMGIDACPGDSGAPLLINFEIVGVVSRGIDGTAHVCGDGSIYARVDAFADWLAAQTSFASGATPNAIPSGADWQINTLDPHPVDHAYAIVSSDGEARVNGDGLVRICASGDATTTVSVTDATDATRSLTVAIATHDAQQCDFTGFDDGGCCAAGAGSSPWLGVMVLALIRSRRWPTSGRSVRRARTTSDSARPTGSVASRPATDRTPATSSARSRAGTATSRS